MSAGQTKSATAARCAIGVGLLACCVVVGSCFDFKGFTEGSTAGSAGSGATGGHAGGAGGIGGTGGVGGTGETGGSAGSTAGTAGQGGTCDTPAGSACNTWPQCGCAEDQACQVLFMSGATACVSHGSAVAGQPCPDEGLDCAIGYTCVGGSCMQYCRLNPDCLAHNTGAVCVQLLIEDADGGVLMSPQARACTQECDPMNPAFESRCAAGMACFPFEDVLSGPQHWLCAAAGTSTTMCTPGAGNCAPGYVCLGGCHRWCRKDMADCADNQTCTKFLSQDGVTLGYYSRGSDYYGYCAP